MKKGRDLLNKSRLLETHPDLHDNFYGLAATYSKVIFSRRMELGYTQKDLAYKADLDPGIIAKAEGGSENLGTEKYSKVFSALQLSMSDVTKRLRDMNELQ